MSRARPAAIGLATLGLVALFSLAFAPQKAAQQEVHWKYTIVKVPDIDGSAAKEALEAAVKAAENRLDTMGADGWELCDTVNGYSIFKRRQ